MADLARNPKQHLSWPIVAVLIVVVMAAEVVIVVVAGVAVIVAEVFWFCGCVSRVSCGRGSWANCACVAVPKVVLTFGRGVCGHFR